MKSEMKVDAAMLERAIIYATEKHKGIRRKGDGKPYIVHPIAVMMILFNLKDSNNKYLIAIAAILHDVVEDCGVSLAEIAELFGHQVSSLVGELTTDPVKCEQMGKTAYLCDKMISMSHYALRIKLADRLHNISDWKNQGMKWKLNYITQTEAIITDIQKYRYLTSSHKKLIKMIMKDVNKCRKTMPCQ